jgi:hypothetical protein
MWTTIGWLVILVAAGLGYWWLKLREQNGGATRRPEEVARMRRPLFGAIGAALVGVLFLAVGSQARPTLRLVGDWDFSKNPDSWLMAGGPDHVKWDEATGRLFTRLEVGSGRRACVPVDWDADAFRAEWDLTIVSLPPKSVIAVGLCDGAVANIDDTDHVAGSTIQATFAPEDIRLRAADTNLLAKSDSMALRGLPRVPPQVGKTYHCVLAYEDVTDTATLQVYEAGSQTSVFQASQPADAAGSEPGRPGIARPSDRLQVEDLRDFSPNMSWLAITVNGYNKLKAEKPTAEAYLDNVKFYKP